MGQYYQFKSSASTKHVNFGSFLSCQRNALICVKEVKMMRDMQLRWHVARKGHLMCILACLPVVVSAGVGGSEWGEGDLVPQCP